MKIDLGKVAVGKPTPCSIALVELIRTMERVDQLYDIPGDLTKDQDRQLSQMNERREALAAQIKREVRERLGVEWDILEKALA